jgi:TRAP-type C4-dicarboxylate transport system permease small subunit
VLLEIGALSLWVALKGLSSPPGASAAGIVFRALTGSLLLGSIGYLGARKQNMTIRRGAAIAGVVLGLLLAKAWARVGVDWSANLLNWYQQASWLTLFGGLRGIGTRLTLLLALLGGSLATAAGRHITIDLVTRFLGPRSRLPVAIIGWLGASMVCFGAAWGFFDHIAIEDFGAKADYSTGQKVKTISAGIGERIFILRKQIALDFKSFPHVVKGESYADWLSGAEWNAWLEDAGFVDRYGKAPIEALKIPPEAKRAPMVVVPEKGEPRGELTHIANLVFPIGLFIIALRFILLSILALSGHKSVDPEAHMELGTGHTDADKTREAAL